MASVAGPLDRSPRLIDAYCFVDDKLIIAVGSSTNTHGVPGLEHCFQLKVRRYSVGSSRFALTVMVTLNRLFPMLKLSVERS